MAKHIPRTALLILVQLVVVAPVLVAERWIKVDTLLAGVAIAW